MWEFNNSDSATKVDGQVVPTRIGFESDWAAFSDTMLYQTLAIKTDGSLWLVDTPIVSDASGGLGDVTYFRLGRDSDWAWADYNAGLALKTDGSLWTWNEHLATPEDGGLFRPVRFGSESDWVSVTSGCLAIKSDGSLWAWGYNGIGQLGLEPGIDLSAPTRIGSDSDWSLVNFGAPNCAIKTDGSLWEWGISPTYAPDSNKEAPVRVGTDSAWVAASGGSGWVVALKSDGTMWEWGQLW
jgi:hypothetical protein